MRPPRSSSRHRIPVLAFTLAALLAAFVRPAAAQVTVNGPYYPLPSWDQTLTANVRYVVLTNFDSNAVLDRETGLVWQRTPSGAEDMTWASASALCLGIQTGNRGGWRLPTVNELSSLLDTSITTTASLFFVGHPFLSGSSSRRFWTATAVAAADGAQHFLVGYRINVFGQIFYQLNSADFDGQFADAWCVRGGLLSGAQ